MAEMTADEMVGSPWQAAYDAVAPSPAAWPTLIAKVSRLVSGQVHDWSAAVAAMTTPMLVIIGDADSIRPTHATALCGLRGGGQVDGGMSGRPIARLAIVPNTTHLEVTEQTDLLLAIIPPCWSWPPSPRGLLEPALEVLPCGDE